MGDLATHDSVAVQYRFDVYSSSIDSSSSNSIAGSGDNNSFITMGFGENRGGASALFILAAANSTNNITGNMSSADPFITPTYTTVWVTLANILVFVVGVLGNLLVIVVVLCVREMKTATNLCLMNLSIADLLVLFICQPSALLEFYFKERWLIGEAMCKLVVYLENLVTVASILIILTVSLERFWAVFYPLKTYSQGSKSKAMISMAIVWITSCVTTIPFLVMAYTEQQYHTIENTKVDVCITSTDYTWQRVYIVGRFVFIFVIPLILLVVIYALIIYKVLTATMECKQMTETAKSQSQQTRKQLVIMLVGIIVLFFTCLLPFRIVALRETFVEPWNRYGIGIEAYYNMIYFCRLLIYINSAGNPIIYNIVSTKFRRAFQKALRLYCCCCKKRLPFNRNTMNGNSSQGTRLTNMSHYGLVKQDNQDTSDTADAV